MDWSAIRRKAAKLFTPLTVRRAATLAASLPRSLQRLQALKLEAQKAGRPLRLIVLPERMGDIVAAEPAGRALRAQGDDYLAWVAGRAFAPLLAFDPDIDGVLEISCLTEWMLLDALSPRVAKTRLYIDGIHCSWFGLIPLRNRNPFGLTMDSYLDQGSLLEAYALLGLGRRLDERPRAFPDPAFDAEAWLAAAGLEGGFIALHCGSAVDAGRIWPAGRYQAVVDWILVHTNFGVLELGLEPVLEQGPRVRRLGGALSLPQQMAVLAGARGFLGGDSGFAHIANALALPAVILLAPYRHFEDHMPFSGPWKRGDGCTVVRSTGPIGGIAVQRVTDALAARIGVSEPG